MSKSKLYEALLVISTAFLVLYLYGMIKHGESKDLFIYLACGIGMIGIFVRPLGRLIALGWYKLAELLSLVMSKVIMAVVYLFILVPVALLSRLGKKDKLKIKRGAESLWISRDHTYSADDLKNIW